MIKGIRKNVYIMKCDKESPFESAMFILKENSVEKKVDIDIVAEAERLIEAAFSDCKSDRSGKTSKRKKAR